MGGVWGVAASVLGLGVGSLIAPQPPGNMPPDRPLVTAPMAGDEAQVLPGSIVTLPDGGPDPVGAASGDGVAAPDAPVAAEDAIVADTAPAAVPETGSVEAAIAAPTQAPEADMAAASEAPVLPNPQSRAPQVPVREEDLILSTEPASQPLAIVVDEPVGPATDIDTPAIVGVADAVPAGGSNLAIEPSADSAPPVDATASLPATTEIPALPVAPESGAGEVAGATAEARVTAGATAPAISAPEAAGDAVLPTSEAAAETALAGETDFAPPVLDENASLATAGETPDVAPAAASATAVAEVIPTEPVATPAPEIAVADPAADPSAPAVIAETPPAAAASPVPDVAVAEPAADPSSPVVVAETPPAADAPSTGDAVIVDSADESPTLPQIEAAPTEPAPEPAVEPETAEPGSGPALQGDAAVLPEGNGAIRVNRPGAEAATDTNDAAAPDTANGPALSVYAAAFANPAGLPELTIILIDDGALPGAAPAVAALGFPVTVAIDPAAAGAAALAAAYLAAGIEIAALPILPAGASATDVAVTFEAAFATLPQAVAVLDVGQGGITAGAGGVPEQALARLAQDGRGFVAVASDLSRVMREAAETGVPSALIADDLDGAGQTAGTIRRFLDGAAFKVVQGETGMVLLARVQPETLSALTQWAGGERARQVALAPLSALLTGD